MLDIPVEEGLARANKRIGIDNFQLSLPIFEDRYERMGAEFHERMRQAFLDMAEREPERCEVISAAMPIKDVTKAVQSVVSKRLEVEFKKTKSKKKKK
jgi:dTMP kinase